MTSSKFSRRPRVQPTPKICRVLKPPVPAPMPPLPVWPIPTMVCTLDWSGPEDPPPDLAVHRTFAMPWVAPGSWYYAVASGGPDQVRTWFNLDLATGAFMVYLEAWRGIIFLHVVTSYYYYTPVDEHIDWHLEGITGLPSGHTLTAHFRTDFP